LTKLRITAEGLRKFLSDGGGIAGLKIPQAVKDSTEEYRRDNNPLSDFVSDRITFNTNARVARNVLLEAYKAFARESAVNDREFALQVRKLITRTHGASFAAEKKTGGNRFWCGIGLIAPSEERD
jgi:phage/plasmid-associated DNA primase